MNTPRMLPTGQDWPPPGTPVLTRVRIAAGRVRHNLAGRRFDRGKLDTLVLFVGNARSGTTLFKSLLDAHPQVLIANELNLLHCLVRGERWHTVLGRIAASSRRFARNPLWTGYDYRVPTAGNAEASVGVKQDITVVGDKTAAVTTKRLARDAGLLQAVARWCPLSLRLIHCTRHPLDVVASFAKRGLPDREQAVEQYMRLENVAALTCTEHGPERCHRVYHERLVADPRAELIRAAAFLNVEADEGWLDACCSVVNSSPHHSRLEVSWPSTVTADLERRAALLPHLREYFANGHLQGVPGTG